MGNKGSKGGSRSHGNTSKPATRRIVDARQDERGNISQVLLQGNQNFTSVSRVVPMVERGEVENVHVVHPAAGEPHLRTNPDRSSSNNLDQMAGDK